MILFLVPSVKLATHNSDAENENVNKGVTVKYFALQCKYDIESKTAKSTVKSYVIQQLTNNLCAVSFPPVLLLLDLYLDANSSNSSTQLSTTNIDISIISLGLFDDWFVMYYNCYTYIVLYTILSLYSVYEI